MTVKDFAGKDLHVGDEVAFAEENRSLGRGVVLELFITKFESASKYLYDKKYILITEDNYADICKQCTGNPVTYAVVGSEPYFFEDHYGKQTGDTRYRKLDHIVTTRLMKL